MEVDLYATKAGEPPFGLMDEGLADPFLAMGLQGSDARYPPSMAVIPDHDRSDDLIGLNRHQKQVRLMPQLPAKRERS
ncbi:hypothetical protein X772_07605 [Mesorhizobium sp. LSJC280B00]|nr:hypothetical protein X772_07605 [Mesorhizobium sp. LSJC280B00]